MLSKRVKENQRKINLVHNYITYELPPVPTGPKQKTKRTIKYFNCLVLGG